jgi:hypothetical protein
MRRSPPHASTDHPNWAPRHGEQSLLPPGAFRPVNRRVGGASEQRPVVDANNIRDFETEGPNRTPAPFSQSLTKVTRSRLPDRKQRLLDHLYRTGGKRAGGAAEE